MENRGRLSWVVCNGVIILLITDPFISEKHEYTIPKFIMEHLRGR